MKKILLIAVISFTVLQSYCQTEVQGFPFSIYAGIKAEYFTLGGDFDGESYFNTDEATISVPKIDPGIAFGLQAGLKFKSASLDMGYQLSSHNYSHINYPSGSTLFHNFKLLGLTFYLKESKRLSPYIVSDISFAWMRIKNGAFGKNSYSGQVDKSYFSGAVLGLGGGLELKFTEKLALHVEALPEWFKLTNLKGITKEYWDVKKFSCFKLNIAAGFYLDIL